MNKKDSSGLWAEVVRVSPGTAIPSLPYLLTFPAARTPVPWSGSSSIYISRAGTPGAHAGAEPPSAGKESSHLSENAAAPWGGGGAHQGSHATEGGCARTENPALQLPVMNGSSYSDLSL